MALAAQVFGSSDTAPIISVRSKLTFPKWNGYPCRVPLFWGPINSLSSAVSLFSNPTRGPKAISRLRGVGNVVLSDIPQVAT